MSDAVGIHAHPTKKLGVRPNDPTRPRVHIGAFLGGVSAPVYPTTDVDAEKLSWPMDKNDSAGDCVVAGSDHALQAIHTLLTGSYTNWTDDQLLKMYQSQNPGFKSWADAGGPNDGGMVIQEALEWLVKEGFILAFGQVDQTNQAEVDAATYVGLAIITGEDLETAQQDQQVWDVVKSADWGGHCTCWVAYDKNIRQVTWGELLAMTQAFVDKQVSEAWFILTQAHVDHPTFRDNFDLAGFAAAVSQLTNGKVVVPVTPAPTPVPPVPFPDPPNPNPPAPVPPDLDAAYFATIKPMLSHKHLPSTDAHKLIVAATEWALAKGYHVTGEHEA